MRHFLPFFGKKAGFFKDLRLDFCLEIWCLSLALFFVNALAWAYIKCLEKHCLVMYLGHFASKNSFSPAVEKRVYCFNAISFQGQIRQSVFFRWRYFVKIRIWRTFARNYLETYCSWTPYSNQNFISHHWVLKMLRIYLHVYTWVPQSYCLEMDILNIISFAYNAKCLDL